MLKKLMVAVLIGAAPVSVSASCETSYTANNEIVRAVKSNKWGFQNYDQVCQKMREANAEFLISGGATVLAGRSITWATVLVKDKDFNIVSTDYGGSSTQVDKIPGTDIAVRNYRLAINNAIDSVDLDRALEALDEARRK